MTPVLVPLSSLVPVADLVHLVLGAASSGVSEGSRRNARVALEAREAAVRQDLEVAASLPAQQDSAKRSRRA